MNIQSYSDYIYNSLPSFLVTTPETQFQQSIYEGNIDRMGEISKKGIRKAFQHKSMETHPDKPSGSHAKMQELNEDYEEVLNCL